MRRSSEDGFILPVVLAVIAIFAAIAALMAVVVSRGQDTMFNLRSKAALEQSAFEAEALTLFTLFTAPPVNGGFLVSSREIDEEAYLRGDAAITFTDLDEAEIWSVKGGARKFQIGDDTAIVWVQDQIGLLSLQAGNDDLLQAYLQSFGLTGSDSQSLVAKLRDYIDPDDSRRFLGGERTDYRLRSLREPANSELRSFAELNAVLEWQETGLVSRTDFLEGLTLTSLRSIPAEDLMPANLEARIGEVVSQIETDPLTNREAGGLPSNRFRLKMVIIDPATGTGLERIVDVTKVAESVSTPYERVIVYQRWLRAADIAEMSIDEIPSISSS